MQFRKKSAKDVYFGLLRYKYIFATRGREIDGNVEVFQVK